jgi:hypothetical protein
LHLLGEQLETISIERQRAQAAYDIIDFYNQMAKNDVSRLDTMRKEGRPGRRQVAVLLRRLSLVAKEVELPNADKVCCGFVIVYLPMTLKYRLERTSSDTARSSRMRCSTYLTGHIVKGTPK